MYFPRDISEIGDFLRSLKYNSNEENIRILDDILDRMRHMHGYTNKEVENYMIAEIFSKYKRFGKMDEIFVAIFKKNNDFFFKKVCLF